MSSEWTNYVIELHKNKSGSSWWCQEKIRVPVSIDGDEYALQRLLEDELLPRMIALVDDFFANWDE